jgi:hypothetical protein
MYDHDLLFIKTQASSRIIEFYPPYRRENIERLAPRFDESGQPAGNYSPADREQMRSFIDRVRARSNVFEATLNAGQALTVDYSDLTP